VMMAGEVGAEVGVKVGAGLATWRARDNKKRVRPGNGNCILNHDWVCAPQLATGP